jgi:uncharacterized protein YhbP (UPF0306 family)
MQPTGPDEVALLREYIAAGTLMQVATVGSDGKPWVVNVWYANTPDLELVFSSNVARVHSEHIAVNQAVAGSIITGELLGLAVAPVRGVTFTGVAHECAGEELDQAYEAYAAKWANAWKEFHLDKIKSGESPMRIYKITPAEFILFDEANYRPPKRVIQKW